MRLVLVFSSVLASALAFVACQGRERPPGISIDGSAGSSSDEDDIGDEDDACEGPPAVDSQCGAEIVLVQQQKPNLYFVLDVSGSMNDPMGPRKGTKIAAAKQSIISVAYELGHRVRYGLTVFPGPDEAELALGCGAGREAFETREGDPILCVNRPRPGPVLEAFASTILGLRAVGNTPLSTSLSGLAPTLLSLDGPTAVILLTDGAPNCNTTTLCGAGECILSLAEFEVLSGKCSAEYNCCDPELADETGVRDPLSWCIDSDASVEQVADLEAAGIPTYVIGVPGVEVFTNVMNRLAVAGGTARAGELAFYDAADTEELTDTLRTIGSEIAQSCELLLKQAPREPTLFNVYFDAAVVPLDEEDGWTLEDDLVTLHGDACDQVKRGEVSEIQMVSGCSSVVK